MWLSIKRKKETILSNASKLDKIYDIDSFFDIDQKN